MISGVLLVHEVYKSDFYGILHGCSLLAFSASANRLQVGYDHLQVPSWSGAVLLG